MFGGVSVRCSCGLRDEAAVADLFPRGLDGGRWLTMTLLAAFAIVLLPRQFHVAVVENASRERYAPRRLAVSRLSRGHQYLRHSDCHRRPAAAAGGADGDTFVLALPVSAGSKFFALIAFLGGLSASTAMVIVEMRRAVDHGVQQSRRARCCCGAARSARRCTRTWAAG